MTYGKYTKIALTIIYHDLVVAVDHVDGSNRTTAIFIDRTTGRLRCNAAHIISNDHDGGDASRLMQAVGDGRRPTADGGDASAVHVLMMPTE